MWQWAVAVDSYRPAGEDRAAVFPTPFGALAVVADGVGGRSGGAAAADAVVGAARRLAEAGRAGDPADWLRDLDRRLVVSGAVGETTAVVADLSDRYVLVGAVGDSVAWAVAGDRVVDLTPLARAKPWVGSGAAAPAAFGRPVGSFDTLLLATDGLTKYAPREAIRDAIRSAPLDQAPRRLIELVRYPSGRLPDDVAVVVARWAENEKPGA